jgi:K(+)-stimulated pyrophosphate-energized sodium pump
MSIVALVIAPSIALSADGVAAYTGNANDKTEISKEVKVEMNANEDGTYKAMVTTTTTEKGEAVSNVQVFEGTEAEVKAKVEALKDVEVNVEGAEIKVKKVIEEVEEKN